MTERRLMNKTIAVAILTIICAQSAILARPVTITAPSQQTTPDSLDVVLSTNMLYCHLHINEEDLRFEEFLGYDVIELQDYDLSAEPGTPLVPVKNLRIALPSERRATQIHLTDLTTQVLPGSYTLYTVSHPQKTRSLGSIPALSASDIAFSSLQPDPTEPLQITGHCDLAGQGMVDIMFYPLIYLPAQRQVSLITSITFAVELAQGYSCGDYLSAHISDQGKHLYQQMVQDMVINPQHVMLRTAVDPPSKDLPAGNYDYVIITQESWVSAFQPLADWKTKKGTPATIVTTEWIYTSGGYSGTSVQKIQEFIKDAQTTWGTLFFLLGGDTDTVPCSTRTFIFIDPEPVPNDTYYSDYDTDYVCEVHIGRASVTGPGSGSGQIGNFISKILTYEKNPPLTSYAKNAGFFGFDLDSNTPAEECKIMIDDSYIPANWTMSNVYDSHPGDHKANVIAAINAGQHLMNHADHSNFDYMGTGYINHDRGLENEDMDALVNGDKQGILYSMGCWPAAYDVPSSIAEHFVRDSDGGGIAFVGNSRYGWYNQGSFTTLSLKYDTYFFKSLFPENNYNLGVCFSDHKNDAYQYDFWGYYKYIFTELTLLGDPELPIWKENPCSLTASHPSQLPLNTSSFTVSVTSDGTPVNQATVCVWKDTEIYETGLTNTAGTITFSLTPSTTGTLLVTTTKHNYLPFESSASIVLDNQPPYIPYNPSPPDQATAVSITEDLSWIGGDPDPGDTVTYDVCFGTTTPPPKIISNQSTTLYDPGTLEYQTTYYWRIIAWDNHGSCAMGPVWQFTTTLDEHPICPLSSTWNFISLPFNQSVDKTHLVVTYNGSSYPWEEAVNQVLILDFIFGWNRTSQYYYLSDLMVPGEGYWVFAYEDCDLSAVNIGGYESNAFITDLLEEWNVFGLPSGTPVDKEDLIIYYNGTMYSWEEAVMNNYVINTLFEWNETSQGYQITEILHPGKSAWLYSYCHCRLLRTIP